MRLLVYLFQPVDESGWVAAEDGVFARKRRIPYQGVEAGIGSAEDLGKLDLPVQRQHRSLASAEIIHQRFDFGAVAALFPRIHFVRYARRNTSRSLSLSAPK